MAETYKDIKRRIEDVIGACDWFEQDGCALCPANEKKVSCVKAMNIDITKRVHEADKRKYRAELRYARDARDFARKEANNRKDALERTMVALADAEARVAKCEGGVDVTALTKLADVLSQPSRLHKGYYEISNLIRKAVDGAQKPDADREDAFSWVEARVELDKRLMPEYMEWPAWSDGLPVTRDDAPESVTAVCLALDGSCYALHYDMPEDERMVHSETGERVKRPEPEVLGADGKPIKVDETVYHDGGMFEVQAVRKGAASDEFGDWYGAGLLTHTPPDTQERIDEDAFKSTSDYFGCEYGECDKCPSEIDGDIPSMHYWKSRDCNDAKSLDLLRRQRELCAKGGEK